MKKIIIIGVFMMLRISAMAPFNFTVASLNIGRFDQNYTGDPATTKFTFPSQVMMPHLIQDAQSYLLQKPLNDIICFQEFPGTDDDRKQFQGFLNTMSAHYSIDVANAPYGSLKLGIAYDKNLFQEIKKIDFQSFKVTDLKGKAIMNGFMGIILEIKNTEGPDNKFGIITTHFKGGSDAHGPPQTGMAKEIIAAIGASNYPTIPWVVCGDFNTTARSLIGVFAAPSWNIASDTTRSTEFTKPDVIDYIFYNNPAKITATTLPSTPKDMTAWRNMPELHSNPWFTDHALIRAKFSINLTAKKPDVTQEERRRAEEKRLADEKRRLEEERRLADEKRREEEKRRLEERLREEERMTKKEIVPLVIPQDVGTLLQKVTIQKRDAGALDVAFEGSQLSVILVNIPGNPLIGNIYSGTSEVSIKKEDGIIRLALVEEGKNIESKAQDFINDPHSNPIIRIGLALFEALRTGKKVTAGPHTDGSSITPQQSLTDLAQALHTLANQLTHKAPAAEDQPISAASLITPFKKDVTLQKKQTVTIDQKVMGSQSSESVTGEEYIYKFGNATILITPGDLTLPKPNHRQFDAIVNAANTGLGDGGGVAGAIYDAADPQKNQLHTACILAAQQQLGKRPPVAVGEAVITDSFALHAQNINWIIHTPGPDCRKQGDLATWEKTLNDSYRNSLMLADAKKLSSIAFPIISSAIFGCDLKTSQQIAFASVINFLGSNPTTTLKTIYLLVYPKPKGTDVYNNDVQELLK